MHENQSSLIARVDSILKTHNLITKSLVTEKLFNRARKRDPNGYHTDTNDIAYVALIPAKTIPDFGGVQQFLDTIDATLTAEGISGKKTEFSIGPSPLCALNLGYIQFFSPFKENGINCDRVTCFLTFAGESYFERFKDNPELSTLSSYFFKP